MAIMNEPPVITDPRHQKRIELMQAVFAYTFFDPEAWLDSENRTPEVDEIISAIPQLDEQIQVLAPERPLKDINKVDLAILRIIVFESNHHKTPVKVLIDEAVELAKEFGSDTSPKFVNGVLGKFFESDQHATN